MKIKSYHRPLTNKHSLKAVKMVDTNTGVAIRSTPKMKDPFLDMTYINEVNKRNQKDAGLFEFYQINAYTKKTLDYTTRKITERQPKRVKCDYPTYDYVRLRESYYKPICPPMTKYSEPQTSSMEYGWFPCGMGSTDQENYDKRFTFSHQTAEFIKTQAMIKAYDVLMRELSATLGQKVTK